MNEYYGYPSPGMNPGNQSPVGTGATGAMSPGATPSPWPPSPTMPGPSMQPGAAGPAPGHMPHGADPGNSPSHAQHDPRQYDVNQYGVATAYPQAGPPANPSIFWLNFSDQQFWKGLLLGAGVTLLVTNETVQKGIMKCVAKVYSTVQGGVGELKEKFEDVQAEVRQKKQEK